MNITKMKCRNRHMERLYSFHTMSFVLLLSVFLLPLSCMAKEPNTVKTSVEALSASDSLVYQELGKTLYELLSSPSNISVYSVIGKENIEKSDFVLETPFVRKDILVKKMDKGDVAILQYLLPFDRENYKNDTVIVRSPYLPTIEFCFSKKKQEAHLLVSLSDGSWTIVYDDKIPQHWNYADKRQIVRFCKRFLDGKTTNLK